MELTIRDLEVKKDPRGTTTELLKGGLDLAGTKEILLITSKPGEVRGNHYHKTKGEWLGVLKGVVELTYTDIETGETKKIVIKGIKPKMVKTPMNVAHASKNIGKSIAYLIEVNDQIYNPENPDSFKKVIVEK